MPKTIIKNQAVEKMFARNYVTNGMQGGKAYQLIRPECSKNNAHVQSTRLLQRESVIQEIKKLLPSDLEDFALISEAYKAKREKFISWADLHRFNRTSLELKGYVGSNRQDNNKQQVNVQLVVEK